MLHESIDSRTESLIALRELGPPDLVHLLKQSTRNQSKQVRLPYLKARLRYGNPVLNYHSSESITM